jgi:hypothetical protein
MKALVMTGFLVVVALLVVAILTTPAYVSGPLVGLFVVATIYLFRKTRRSSEIAKVQIKIGTVIRFLAFGRIGFLGLICLISSILLYAAIRGAFYWWTLRLLIYYFMTYYVAKFAVLDTALDVKERR